MKQILESIILNIVDNREAVSIEEQIDGQNIIYSVKVADNDMGIAGVASRSNVKIMSLKVLGDEQDSQGIRGYTDSLIEAIQYAEANGASICNMSLGYTMKDEKMYEVMKESDMLFICAAGNVS